MAAPNNNNQQPPIEPEPVGPEEPVPLDMRLPAAFEVPAGWQIMHEMPPERPHWLPNDWGMELARSFRGNRYIYCYYYIAPSGIVLRSKKHVLSFLANQIHAAQPEEEAPAAGRGRGRGRGGARRGRGG